MAVSSTSFQKGNKLNPNLGKGRPKGSPNKSTLLRAEFEKRAEEDLLVVYDGIINAIKAGESWAYSLFFKECLAPKKKETALISVEGDRLPAFLEGLQQFQELTYDEVLAGIKAFTSVKLAEKIQEFTRERSEEEKHELLKKLEYTLDHDPQYLEWRKSNPTKNEQWKEIKKLRAN